MKLALLPSAACVKESSFRSERNISPKLNLALLTVARVPGGESSITGFVLPARPITLRFDRDRGVIAVPLPDGLGKRTVTLVSPLEMAVTADQAPTDAVQHTLREVAK